jgi:hypothetical protein
MFSTLAFFCDLKYDGGAIWVRMARSIDDEHVAFVVEPMSSLAAMPGWPESGRRPPRRPGAANGM